MALGKIDNVDVVAHTCAVDSWVVLAEHVEVWQVTAGYSLDVGHQVVRDALRVFADLASAMSSDRVEVAQANCGEVTLLRDHGILEDLLDHGLCLAIGVGGADRFVLRAVSLLAIESR